MQPWERAVVADRPANFVAETSGGAYYSKPAADRVDADRGKKHQRKTIIERIKRETNKYSKRYELSKF